MRFVWDPRKAASNLRRHGVRFEEAATAFDDPLGAYYPDRLHESRFILLGFSRRDRLLYVVHAEVGAEAIRIISARKATRHEKARYETTDLPIGFADHERMKTHRVSPSDVGTDSAGHQGRGGRTTRSEGTIVRDPRAARKTASDPLDGPVDFARFGPVRRNAFAGCGEPGGPSLLALWEMPELATDAVLLRRGRPAHGARMTTTVRSVRLPDALWAEIERAAKAKHLNLHQAMRAALLGWIRRAG